MTEENTDEIILNHWRYIREVIRDGRDEETMIYLPLKDYLDHIGFHYREAMRHGWKHGKEEKEKRRNE